MRFRDGTRLAGMLLLVGFLGAGLWTCARDTTSSSSCGLRITLGAADEVYATADSVEIQICRGAGVVAADKVAVGPGGSFSVTLAAAAGESYEVRAYAWGAGPDLHPDSSARGVVAFGSAGGIKLTPGRLTDVRVVMQAAEARILAVEGQVGRDTLRLTWEKIHGASVYTLGWLDEETGLLGRREEIADTCVALDWDDPGGKALMGAEDDSVLFRVQPRFETRPGVFGPGYWVNLSSWMDLPHLVSIAPGTGEIVDADTVRVWLGFDRPMDETSLEAGLQWTRVEGGGEVAFEIEPLELPAPARFRLAPGSGQIEMGNDYVVSITPAVTDTAGRPFDDDPEQDGLQTRLVQWSAAAYSPLQVIEMDPLPGATGVDPDVELRLIMNRRVAASTLSDSSCFVTDPDGIMVAGECDTAAAADTIRWWALEPLWFGTTYTFHLTPQLRDVEGIRFDNDAGTYPELDSLESPFTIYAQPPSPRVVAVQPESGAVAVRVHALVQVTFSTAVDSSTVRYDRTFQILRDGIFALPGTIGCDATCCVYTFTPGSPLEQSTRYVVHVSGVKDPAGNQLDQDLMEPGYQPFISEFRTEGSPIVVGSDPAPGDSAVSLEAVIALDFSRTLDPATITEASVRLLRGEVALACSRLLEEDSLHLEITPADSLAYLTTYRLLVDTLVTAADGSPLDQDPATLGRQPFELFFTTEPESLHPRVTPVYPTDGDSNVAVGDSVHVTFTLPINSQSLGSESFVLTRISGPGAPQQVAGAIETAPDSLSATFTPTSLLHDGISYRVRVTSTVISATGFPIDQNPDSSGCQDFESTFRTAPESVAPLVIYSDPEDGEIGVPLGVTVVVQFSEAIDSASARGAFSLTANAVGIPGDGGLDGSGEIWTFVPQAPLTWGAACTVRVDTTALDLAGNGLDQYPDTLGRQPFEIAFTAEADFSGPRVIAMEPDSTSLDVWITDTLRVAFTEPLLPASVTTDAFRVAPEGGDPLEGVLTLEFGDSIITWTPALPLQFATRYNVTADTLLQDVRENGLDQEPGLPGLQPFTGFFMTMPETLAPCVLPDQSHPADGETGVPVDVTVTLQFSEPMNPTSVAGAFTLSANGTPVEGLGVLDGSGQQWTFDPSAPLAWSAACTVRVDTTAFDLAGNGLDQDPETAGQQSYQSLFVTEQALRVVSVDPEDMSVNVDPDTVVRIEFSQPVDPATVGMGTIYLFFGGRAQVSATYSLHNGNRQVELDPDQPLAQGETHWLLVTPAVTDTLSHPLDQDLEQPGNQCFSSYFTVAGSP